MNIIELYENLKGSYKSYLESFVAIKDERIKEKVSDSIKHEELWPKALIQFNPNIHNQQNQQLCRSTKQRSMVSS